MGPLGFLEDAGSGLRPSLGHVGPLLTPLLGPRGAVVEPSWALLEALGRVLEPSWGLPVPSLDHFEHLERETYKM